jgi:hypothetical protein
MPTLTFDFPIPITLSVTQVVGTQQFTDGGQSIMEAVALAKLQAADSVASGGAASSAVSSLADSASTAVQSGTVGSTIVASTVTKGAAAASWRPGLFQIIVGGRVSDVLGLGKYSC